MGKKRLFAAAGAAVLLCALLAAAMAANDLHFAAGNSPLGAETQTEPGVGEKWYAFRVAVGGTVLELPCPVAALAASGWKTGVNLDEPMRPGEYADVKFDSPGGFLAARVGNPGAAPLMLGECDVVALTFHGTEKEALATLPGGVGIGAGYDDVLAAWGQPDTWRDTAENVLHYSTGRNDWIELAFENGAAVRIGLQRLQAPAAPPESLPAEVLAWAAPEALGTDPWSYDILYDGDLYTLPAPVAAFLENGWALRDAGTVEPGGFLMGVTLVRGNQRLRTRLVNFSDTPQPLGGCFVVMAESSPRSCQLPMTLAGGLTENTTYEAALAALGPPDETYGERVFERRTTLTWYGPEGRVTLYFTGEAGAMTLYDFEVWHEALD